MYTHLILVLKGIYGIISGPFTGVFSTYFIILGEFIMERTVTLLVNAACIVVIAGLLIMNAQF